MRKRKFTDKKYSKRGVISCLLASASLGALVYLVADSFFHAGKGGAYLGNAGILALIVAFAAFVQAVKSIKEDDTFRGIPIASMALSILAMGSWIALYAVGFLAS